MPLSYKSAVRAVIGRGFGVRADQERIKAIVELLDHPELSYPTIHIAGTNGKTTTARIISAILAAHGLNCGVYTSPHLQSIRERFARFGVGEGGFVSELIEPNAFAELVQYLTPFIEMVENQRGEQVTYFETTTAMALEWMGQLPVDAGIIEAGMGGEWDATNVVQPRVAALTHIDVDHHKFLGSTPVDNAREKVGIIKPGVPVVSGPQREDTLEVIEGKCRETESQLLMLGRDFAIKADGVAHEGRSVTISGIEGEYADLFLPLHGSHQSRNLAIAIATCESFLGRALDDQSTRAGLSMVRSPGRLELLRREPLVVLDGAHNPDGAAALGAALEETFGDLRRTFVMSISKGKDYRGILERLLPYADRIIFTRQVSYPCEDPELLVAQVPSDKAVGVVDSMADAVDQAISLVLDDEMVVITGSLYGVGEARDHLVGAIP